MAALPKGMLKPYGRRFLSGPNRTKTPSRKRRGLVLDSGQKPFDLLPKFSVPFCDSARIPPFRAVFLWADPQHHVRHPRVGVPGAATSEHGLALNLTANDVQPLSALIAIRERGRHFYELYHEHGLRVGLNFGGAGRGLRGQRCAAACDRRLRGSAGSGRAWVRAVETPAVTGRPGHDPRDLLNLYKLYVCGYFNEVHSSRRLERACRSTKPSP